MIGDDYKRDIGSKVLRLTGTRYIPERGGLTLSHYATRLEQLEDLGDLGSHLEIKTCDRFRLKV